MKTINSMWFGIISQTKTTSWIATWVLASIAPASSVFAEATAGETAQIDSTIRSSNRPKGEAADHQTVTASASTELPTETREQLGKQIAAMKGIYLNSDERRRPTDADHPPAVKIYSVYFEGSSFYERRHTLVLEENGKQTTQDIDSSFDGNFAYSGDPKQPGRNPEAILCKYSLSDTTDPDRAKLMFQFPYLNAAGFYAPEYIPDLERFSSIQPLVLYYLEQSDSTQIEKVGENLHVTVLVTVPPYKTQEATLPKRRISFLLDAKHGYAVAEREEQAATGQRILRIEAEDWKYYATASIWLPNRCLASYYTNPFKLDEFSDQPIFTVTHQLNTVRFGHQKVPFDLAIRPDYKEAGTKILDRTLPEALTRPDHMVSYTLAANGQLLRGAAERVTNRGRIWLFVVLILGLPPIIVLFRYRRVSPQV